MAMRARPRSNPRDEVLDLETCKIGRLSRTRLLTEITNNNGEKGLQGNEVLAVVNQAPVRY
jgi:hypothetical protein